MATTRRTTTTTSRTSTHSRRPVQSMVRKPRARVVSRKTDVEPKEIVTPAWQFHPYRSFVEGLPVWLAILTIYMFAVVYLQSWTFALVFTLLLVVLVALLFDILHNLHKHLQVPEKHRTMYNSWLTRFGRGMLVGFSVYFLILFLLFAFSFEQTDTVVFAMGTAFTLIGIGLVFFLVLSYIALIIFLGFPRIQHQLSLASLLFFCYFYLFFAFAVRRIEL